MLFVLCITCKNFVSRLIASSLAECKCIFASVQELTV